MKLRKCLMCGSWFEAYQAHQHVCDSCADWENERQEREEAPFADTAAEAKARIEEGLAKNPLWRKEGEKQPQAGVRKELEP